MFRCAALLSETPQSNDIVNATATTDTSTNQCHVSSSESFFFTRTCAASFLLPSFLETVRRDWRQAQLIYEREGRGNEVMRMLQRLLAEADSDSQSVSQPLLSQSDKNLLETELEFYNYIQCAQKHMMTLRIDGNNSNAAASYDRSKLRYGDRMGWALRMEALHQESE